MKRTTITLAAYLLVSSPLAQADDQLFFAPPNYLTSEIPRGKTINDGNLVFTNQRPDEETENKWLDHYLNYQYGDTNYPVLVERVDALYKAIRANLTADANRTEIVLESYRITGYVPDLGVHERVLSKRKPYPPVVLPNDARAAFLASLFVAAFEAEQSPKVHRYIPTEREYCEATVVAKVNGVRMEVSVREPIIGKPGALIRVTEKANLEFVTQMLTLLSS